MDVILQENDRVVLEYRAPSGQEGAIPPHVILVNEAVENCGSMEVYMVLWEKDPKARTWQLMWRGDFDTCAKQFIDIVESVDRDAMIDKLNALRQRTVENLATAPSKG